MMIRSLGFTGSLMNWISSRSQACINILSVWSPSYGSRSGAAELWSAEGGGAHRAGPARHPLEAWRCGERSSTFWGGEGGGGWLWAPVCFFSAFAHPCWGPSLLPTCVCACWGSQLQISQYISALLQEWPQEEHSSKMATLGSSSSPCFSQTGDWEWLNRATVQLSHWC